MTGKRKKRTAHFLVEGVNLGDGRFVRCWVHVNGLEIVVRRYRAHRAWRMSLDEAAGILARAAQLIANARAARLPLVGLLVSAVAPRADGSLHGRPVDGRVTGARGTIPDLPIPLPGGMIWTREPR